MLSVTQKRSPAVNSMVEPRAEDRSASSLLQSTFVNVVRWLWRRRTAGNDGDRLLVIAVTDCCCDEGKEKKGKNKPKR
jgi:hypothetical protein